MDRTLLHCLLALSLSLAAGCGDSSLEDGGGKGGGTSPGDGGSDGAGGNPFAGSGGSTSNGQGGNCAVNLTGTVRDFRAFNGGAGHPDFEVFGGNGLDGLVEFDLGADHKPVYAHPGGTAHTTGPSEFAQWFNDVEGVNMAFPFTITPVVGPDGGLTYANNAFFPIDGQGFGNEGNEHNYHFTYELHMEFAYKGGEVFTFTGDDDLWVFINNRLGIDLGGLHPALSETIDLDAMAGTLGITVGQTYALDLFQAERHTSESNFTIQSSLEFTNCDPIVF
jgi:fibro-slime domain-containing protein